MKLFILLLALFALLAAINAQSVQVVLCTYYDNSCLSISECSVEITNMCTPLLGGVSMLIRYNANGTGIVSAYTQANCVGTATNTSFMQNQCAQVMGGSSLNVLTNTQLFSTTTLYSGSPATCTGTGVGYSAFTSNVTGSSCTPTNCTTGPFSAYQTRCAFAPPATCPLASSGFTYAATYSQSGCPVASTVSYSCNLLTTCIPAFPGSNASATTTCNNGVPSGTAYVGPGCTGNITVPVGVNTTTGVCYPTGISPGFMSVSCVSPSPTTTGSSTSATTSGSTSSSSLITFSVVAILSILSMIALSILI